MKCKRNGPDPQDAFCVHCGSAVNQEKNRYEYMAMASERETVTPVGVGVWYKLEQSGFVQLSAPVCRSCIAKVRRRHLWAWLASVLTLLAVLISLAIVRSPG